MKQTRFTWSFFQSPEVRDICANLTPAEHARLMTDARQRGSDFRWRLAIPFIMVAGLFLFSWQLGIIPLIIFAFYFAASVLPRLRDARRRNREMLCETEWAYNRGCKPERLKMLRLPWFG